MATNNYPPIISAVKVRMEDSGTSAGSIILDLNSSYRLIEVMICSASFLQVNIPSDFCFGSGEIFYDENYSIEEVRIAGIVNSEVDNKGFVNSQSFTSEIQPRLTIDPGKKLLFLDKRDENRYYIAAMLFDRQIWLKWRLPDGKSGEKVKNRTLITLNLFDILPEKINSKYISSGDIEKDVLQIAKVLKSVPIKVFPKLLLADYPLVNELAPPFLLYQGKKKLIYHYDPSELRAELAEYFLKCVDFSEKAFESRPALNTISGENFACFLY